MDAGLENSWGNGEDEQKHFMKKKKKKKKGSRGNTKRKILRSDGPSHGRKIAPYKDFLSKNFSSLYMNSLYFSNCLLATVAISRFILAVWARTQSVQTRSQQKPEANMISRWS